MLRDLLRSFALLVSISLSLRGQHRGSSSIMVSAAAAASAAATAALPTQDTDTEWGRAVERPEEKSCHEPSKSSIEHFDVAIVGGGLAGLATAIGLARQGVQVRVFERASELRSVSQGMLALRPNGLAALERIHPDIPRLVLEAGSELLVTVITIVHADGTVTEKTRNLGSDSRTKYGRPSVLITWHKLQQVLAGLLPSNIVVTDRSLLRFEEDENHVKLYFKGGAVVQASAVLACDGVFSVARQQLFPKDSPIFFGQVNWGSIIETSELPENMHPPNAVHVLQFEGEPRWMSMLNDAGAGQTFWQLRVGDPAKALPLSGNNGRGGLGLSGVKEALAPVVRPSSKVSAALEKMPEKQIFERSIVALSPLTTWLSPSGRLALVGDSAHGMHPNIGHGGNSAFESAAAVIDAIADASANNDKAEMDWRSALASFEDLRKPRADLVQRFSNMMGTKQTADLDIVSKEQASAMLHWILAADPDMKFPTDVAQVLEAFDPCDSPRISLLW